jgi:hypothetical protein
LNEKVAAPVWKTELMIGGIRCADHATPSIHKKFALTSPTSGGRSVGIVRLRAKGHGVYQNCMIELFLTSTSRDVLEKTIATRLLKIFTVSYGSRRFITMFFKAAASTYLHTSLNVCYVT